MAGELDGKVALITGGGAGLGRSTALVLAREGARVVVADVSADAARSVVEEIGAFGGAAEAVTVDVADEGGVAEMIGRVVDRFGVLDVAVNNAAVRPDASPIIDLDVDVFDRLLAVNLRGVALCMKHEARRFREQGAGDWSIVNIGSTSSLRPQPTNPAYVAAKHGVVGLTKTGAVEMAPLGIRVNAVLPGAMDTPMIRSVRAAAGREMGGDESALSLLGRLADPREVGEAISFLGSSRASYITGAVLAVDAGYTAR